MIFRKVTWLRNRQIHEEKQNTTAYFEEEENIWLLLHLLQSLKMLLSSVSLLFHFLPRISNLFQVTHLPRLNVMQETLQVLNKLFLYTFKLLFKVGNRCFDIGLNEEKRKRGTGTPPFSYCLSLKIRTVSVLCTGFRRKKTTNICLEYLIQQRLFKIYPDIVTKRDFHCKSEN